MYQIKLFKVFKKLLFIFCLSIFLSPFPQKAVSTPKDVKSQTKKSHLKAETLRKMASVKSKRKLAAKIECIESYTGIYAMGTVVVGSTCEADSCISFYEVFRNSCSNGKLTVHFCDPKSKNFFSEEEIQCPEGCASRLFCKKPKEKESIESGSKPQ